MASILGTNRSKKVFWCKITWEKAFFIGLTHTIHWETKSNRCIFLGKRPRNGFQGPEVFSRAWESLTNTHISKFYTIKRYEGTSDPNVLSEQNVLHQKNVLYCSVLTEHFKMFLFCSKEHLQTTENIQIHHDHVIFELNFFF